jgi:hypothetical protein
MMQPDVLLDLERGFWEAALDPEHYREHLARDALLVFPWGIGALDYQATIDAIAENDVPWSTYRFESVATRPLGDEAALLAYRVVACREGDPEEFHAWITSVYAVRDGTWKLVFHQQTLGE